MITDVHTHYWTPEHQSPPWTDGLSRVARKHAAVEIDRVTVDSYLRQVSPAERTIVFGLQAAAAGMWVPNDAVVSFVEAVGGQTVGFMSVDPTRADAVEEVERCHQDLGLVGIKLGPIYQGTSPLHPLYLRVFSAAERLGLPVMIHQGAIFTDSGRLRDASPALLDDIALAFPRLRMIIAHLGHPWIYETAVVMRRHPHVYADTSALPNRPTVLAHALTAVKEYGVLDKVLFGSDSPMVGAASAVEALHRIAAHTQRHAITPITDDDLHDLLHRPSFDLLGISAPSAPIPRPEDSITPTPEGTTRDHAHR
ncbi:amidohydrolase family protein [Nocardioides carbamazepini]|uniref:amidohydrolase family protein n=1 Tax=Nocardioides carbamazepini TaxID=2854259 RepID=UPI00214A157A|nr:amidohydrolase family protein [Nocardioides carbamazepini]MCR1783993.1 amidohydrolase family protein [Nocardioides carbamazepini]